MKKYYCYTVSSLHKSNQEVNLHIDKRLGNDKCENNPSAKEIIRLKHITFES